MPSTGAQPSRAAAMASTPEPQPTSTSAPAGLELEQQLEAQPRGRVRARAEGLGGVDDDVVQAARAAAPTAGARSSSPTCTGWWKAFQRSSQSSATSVVVTSTSAVAGGRAQVGEVGQLAGRAVDRVLDDVAVLALLHPARRELEQLGEHELGLLALHPQRRGGSSEQALELADQRLVGAQVLVGHRVGQLLGQAALVLAELARDDDVDHHAQVAVAARAAQARHALAADGDDGAGLRAGHRPRRRRRRRATER